MKPYHIAIIPDGNRRWAREHKITRERGYDIGISNIENVLRWCKKYKIRMLSMWGFSMENFSRNRGEIESLFGLFKGRLAEILRRSNTHSKYRDKVRVRFIGRRELFPKKLQDGMAQLERLTQKNKPYSLNLFLGYGGRQEIIDAAKKFAQEFASGRASALDEKKFSGYLYTSGIPDPDLIIRTSNEHRTSGLMPFQAAYSELIFCKKLWPDFSESDFQEALEEYARRKRRFGK
jgi:undecaprenyl diphosphate synthase